MTTTPRLHRTAHRRALNRAQWLRQCERGSATAELALIAPVLVLLMLFIAVVIHRGVDARLRLASAAHQSARAASIERTPSTAGAAARAAAEAALSTAGVVCRDLSVDTATDGFAPGGRVTVTLTCRTDFGDALKLGVPAKKLTASASEPIDAYRSAAGDT
jgi:Flp pilus assembly protein TadG